LHAKAKACPNLRFDSLYDKVYRKDVLTLAWQQCAGNGGAAGVDGVTFEQIEEYGVERWLGELAEELKEKSYQPGAVRRVFIPKPNGKKRPLGIPTIKDRVVQTAVALIVGPIVEADLPQEQHAYRPNRGALDAVVQVHRLVNLGHTEVVDADLSGYFDSIPHAELMKCVARRISDGGRSCRSRRRIRRDRHPPLRAAASSSRMSRRSCSSAASRGRQARPRSSRCFRSRASPFRPPTASRPPAGPTSIPSCLFSVRLSSRAR
jgi:retron-type reverse transcriptase